MLFSTLRTPGSGQPVLTCTVEDYDAFRFPSVLTFDWFPTAVQSGRMAVANAILFGRRCGGRLWFENPISPLAATAIRRYLDNATLEVGPIDYVPQAEAEGHGKLYVDLVGVNENQPSKSAQIEISAQHLVVERSDQMAGSLIGLDRAVVASNAWLFVDDSLSAIEVAVAVGVLFAEARFADCVALSGPGTNTDIAPLEALLAACGLGLQS